MADVSILDIAGSQWSFKDNGARSEIYATNYKFQIAQSYSTAETDTGGTWIDGKKIYRRVFTKTTANYRAGSFIDLATSGDLSVLGDIGALVKSSVAGFQTIGGIPYPKALNNIVFRIDTVNKKIQYLTPDNYDMDAGSRVILEYTKK